jgi:hypothetical protein
METSSIADLWNSERPSEVRRYHLTSDLSDLLFCRACRSK